MPGFAKTSLLRRYPGICEILLLIFYLLGQFFITNNHLISVKRSISSFMLAGLSERLHVGLSGLEIVTKRPDLCISQSDVQITYIFTFMLRALYAP